MEQQRYDQAINYAFRLLSFKMRTVKELATRLAKRDFDQETITSVIDRLQELGYLNDSSYVESYVHSKVKPTGRKRMEYELVNKGISKETVTDKLQETYSEAQELGEAKQLAAKLWQQEQKFPKNKQNFTEQQLKNRTIQKIAQKMLNRGFSYTIVKQVIHEISPDVFENS